MMTKEIILEAIEKYKPVRVVLMVSGGHDSITNAHVSAGILNRMGVEFVIYHGDTTIGIPQTQQYVIDTCKSFEWDLNIRKPPNEKDWYDNLIAKFGFPGPTRMAHQIMYRSLKERALNRFVTHECKSSPQSRETVLLLTGVRQDESRVRMGYTQTTTKQYSKIWCNPIFYWSEDDCKKYMADNVIPQNPVKLAICISGECLCGAFAGKEELSEIKANYPEVAARIAALHEISKANGKPWGWSSGPKEWKHEQQLKRKLDLFMCVGCENKKEFQ